MVISGNLGISANATLSFEYGTTDTYGNTASAVPFNTFQNNNFSAFLNGLTPNTLYHYRAKAVSGNITACGNDLIFHTSQLQYALTVSKVGNGTISPSTGTYYYLEGASVSLNATADSGWEFLGWSSQDIAIADPSASQLSFNMPAKSVSVNATFSTPPYAASGPVGGGGGSVSITQSPKRVTISGLKSSADLNLDAFGRVQSNVQLKTGDGNITFDISKNTVLCDSDSVPLKNLSATILSSPHSPPPQNVIVLAYEFGPEGAVFKPAITLTVPLDTKKLPEGTVADSVTIAFWDGVNWVSEKSKIEDGNIIAQIDHFSQWVLMAKVIPLAKSTPVATVSPIASPGKTETTPTMESQPNLTPSVPSVAHPANPSKLAEALPVPTQSKEP